MCGAIRAFGVHAVAAPVDGDQVQISMETAGDVDPAALDPIDPLGPLFLGTSRFEFPTTPKVSHVSAAITL